MARRKPILKPMVRLNARDAMWAQIRAFEGDFTGRELRDAANVGRDTAWEFLKLLAGAGILASSVPAEPFQPVRYRLERDLGVEPPRFRGDGTLDTEPTDQERMWAAAKAMPSFSYRDMMVATGITSAISVRGYILALVKAGYLVVETPRGARPARYRLLPSRNSGPRPPALRKSGTVWDLNLGRQVYPAVQS